MNILKIATLVIISLTTLSAQKTTTFNIQIDGYNQGAGKLLGIFADENYFVDSAKIDAQGRMTFKNPEGYQEGMFYLLLPDRENFSFFIASGENNFTLKTQRGALVPAMQVSNSLENTLYFDNLKYQVNLEQKFNVITQKMQTLTPNSPQLAELRKEQQALLDEREGKIQVLAKEYPKAFFTKFKLAGQNPKLRYVSRPDGSVDSVATMVNYRYDWWNDFDFSDSRLIRTPVFFNKMTKYIKDLTTQHQDTLVNAADFLLDKTLKNKDLFQVAANWIGYQYKPGVTALMDGEAVYSHIILKYFTPERAFWMKTDELKSLRDNVQNMRASLLGMVGKDVQARDKNGVMRSIYEIKAPFKAIYIYAPNCEHCQEETPRLRKVYDAWKSKGLEIFSIVVTPKDRNEWQNFAQKYGVNWIDVNDPTVQSRYHEKYFVDITPELYLLDKDNRIIAKNLKPNQLPEVLEREMAKVK